MEHENKFIQYGSRNNNFSQSNGYKEKSNRGNNRKKILAAFMMLLVTTVSLSTASYAWFTANTTVTIGQIEVNVGASSGLQISTDAVNWKSAITAVELKNNAYAGNTNRLPENISPVSTALALDSNGYLSMFKGSLVGDTNAANGYYLEASAEEEASGNYIAFDVFVQYNGSGSSALPVYLTNDSDITESGTSGVINSARAAFIVEGIATNAAVAANATAATSLKNNAASATTVYLWEPNADKHVATGTSNAALYGISAPDGTALSSYQAVKAAIPASTLDYLSTSNATYFTTITNGAQATYTMFQTNANDTANRTNQTLWSMTPGYVAKIRVYVWMEGQDVDCENNVSGNNFLINIKFSKNA